MKYLNNYIIQQIIN